MCESCEPVRHRHSRRKLLQVGTISAFAIVSGGLTNAALAEETKPTPHWTYEGEEGPDKWGELDESYSTCSGGTHQSPIDLTGATEGDLSNIEFDYNAISPLHIINNGHTAQVNVPAGNSITLDGIDYPLKQFHFHAPSEHTIDGVAQAMELHLVHITDDGSIAVVGILLQEGAENPALDAVFAAMPAMAGPEQEVKGSVDLNALLPSSHTTFRYSGSLTTPPCSEGVNWLVMTEQQTVATAQVAAFRNVFTADARPVQPLNNREVDIDTTS